MTREVVYGYLRCGDLREGFARVRCPDCREEFLLSFSCKGRWFCPSCHSKKVIQFAEHLRDNILYPIPHRQYVFSIPIMLRIYFKYDRGLLSRLCHCAYESLLIFLRKTIASAAVPAAATTGTKRRVSASTTPGPGNPLIPGPKNWFPLAHSAFSCLPTG